MRGERRVGDDITWERNAVMRRTWCDLLSIGTGFCADDASVREILLFN